VAAQKCGRKIDIVFSLEVSEKVAEGRVRGRYSCKRCGKIYNKSSVELTKKSACEGCGGKEFDVREDDVSKSGLKERFAVFNKNTKPILEHYKNKGVLHQIKAEAPVKSVRDKMLEVMKNLDQEREGQ
jgi:adenylate kinase